MTVRARLRRIARGRRFAGSGLVMAPGLLDSGLASLAGFSGSLYAARVLDERSLGVYALYFAAFMVASQVPRPLLFDPSHVAVLASPRGDRVALLPTMLVRGAVASTTIALPLSLIGLAGLSDVSAERVLMLASTALALSIVSPLQDYLRATMHLAGRHVLAAGTSLVQLVVALASLGLLHLAGVAPEWIPFGAIAVANVASTAFGLGALRAGIAAANCPVPSARELLRSGRTLLVASLLPAGALLGGSVLLLVLASAEELGRAEAARVVAMPITVFGVGARQAIRPLLMEAGHSRRFAALRGASSSYVVVVVGFGLAYAAAVGWSHPLNPMERLIPLAFVRGGLVPLFVLSFSLAHLSAPPYLALLGAGKERVLLRLALMSALTRITVVVGLAALAGAYALPASGTAAAVIGGGAGWIASRRAFDRADTVRESPRR